MSYEEWFEQHAAKHKKIVEKLVAHGLSEDEINHRAYVKKKFSLDWKEIMKDCSVTHM